MAVLPLSVENKDLSRQLEVARPRALRGLDLIRGRSLDGRGYRAVSAASFLGELFALAPCPPVGETSFWTVPDGSIWMLVERERSDVEDAFVVSFGSMADGAAVLEAVGVVVEGEQEGVLVRAYSEGAFFDDQIRQDVSAITLQKRVEEAMFMSRLGPGRWRTSWRFDTHAAPAHRFDEIEVAPIEEGEDGTYEAGGDDDGGSSTYLVDC
ncbi:MULTISPECIES: hypothetical protein [unclassified Xanthobacter]|uniref:hypothetical protein n=1 Tax=unclassified Xanthobacter TaxID=2623496 RepID=UPI001F188AC2|nr:MULTISPECIES: hypothetical protein [unclassified Xanthobacter]